MNKGFLTTKTNTGDPRLMRISLLQFFKTFHRYLAYAFFGLFISLVRFLGQKQPKNRTNEINSPKFALGKSHLANANFSQNQKSHQARTLCRTFFGLVRKPEPYNRRVLKEQIAVHTCYSISTNIGHNFFDFEFQNARNRLRLGEYLAETDAASGLLPLLPKSFHIGRSCGELSLLIYSTTFGLTQSCNFKKSINYSKVASSRLSWLVAHLRIFRLFMKVKFDAYVP